MRDNLFARLPAKDRHTKCTRCNRLGCNQDSLIHHLRFQFWLWRRETRARIRAWVHSFGALDYSKLEDVRVTNIDTSDYPDFCDAYIESATYKGRDITQAELERLNEDSSYIYDRVIERLY